MAELREANARIAQLESEPDGAMVARAVYAILGVEIAGFPFTVEISPQLAEVLARVVLAAARKPADTGAKQ